jgi:hypothetical protein
MAQGNTITRVVSRSTAEAQRTMAALDTRKLAESSCDQTQRRITITVSRRDIIQPLAVAPGAFDAITAVRGGVSTLRISWSGNGVEDQYEVGAAPYVSVIVPACDHWTVRAVSLSPSITSGTLPPDANRPDVTQETFNVRDYSADGSAQSRRNATVFVAVDSVTPVAVPIPPGSVRMQAVTDAVAMLPLVARVNLSQSVPINAAVLDWHVMHNARDVLVGPSVGPTALVALTFTVETN